jgi:PE-PPE domain/PE family
VSFVIATPEVLAAAATDLANIGSVVSDANAAAASMTTKLAPAALDEVSAAVAALFGTHAHEYQALATQASVFHERFTQVVTASAASYLSAESANVTALLQPVEQDLVRVVNAPAAALLGHPLVGSATSSVAATQASVSAAVQSAATPVDTTVFLGFTGAPIPSPSFINAVNQLFIEPNLVSASLQTLFTPEQVYPFTGVRSLTGDASVAQGVQILNNQITSLLNSGTNPIGVFGYSQGATIASMEMPLLQAAGVPSSAVHFVLIGDSTPNGGIGERFIGLQLPSLGTTYNGGTPSNAYPTTIYTLEYDMYADFPRYPLNLLSDLNVIVGAVHFEYPNLTATQVQNAIHLATSGPTMTDYYVIPINDLPLVDPLRAIPIIGNPIADLLKPDLTYLVNLGYGDPLYGWSTSPANVPTPLGLFPPLSSFQQLPGLLVSGAGQGIQNFVGDFTGSGPNPVLLPSVSSMTSLLDPYSGTGGSISSLSGSSPGLQAFQNNPAGTLASLVTDVANTISSSASSVYSVLLPTADIINAAAISIPAYDVSLFLNNLSNPVDAVGLPIAANTALYSMLLNEEIEVLAAVL